MAEITAAMVKALREETQQGMMECKKALDEAQGDIEAAKDILRRKGLATVEKKAGRTTKEGLVGLHINDDRKTAAMAELQCETDFCARNEEFQTMVRAVTASVLASDTVGAVAPTSEMAELVQGVLAKIGENMGLASAVRLTAPRIGAYLHHNGRVGVLVGVEGEISDETLNDICMHIAFAEPMGITPEDIPAAIVEKEKSFALEEAVASGKPQDIAEKMVAGKIRKFLAGLALLEQPFVKDDKKTVREVVGSAQVTAFARLAVGSEPRICVRK